MRFTHGGSMGEFDGFQDKRVLITGAADGIGFALASALVQAGAKVFLSDIAAEKLVASAAKLDAPSGVCDVTDAEAANAVVQQAWQQFGGLDLVCANAGVFKGGSLLDASQADIDYQFDVNVWGMLNIARPAIARLREAGAAGHILFTGSENSFATPSYLKKVPAHVYNMTKHAVLSMADGLRAELESDNIAVSVLCPGPVVSGLSDNSGAVRPERYGGPTRFELDVGDVLDEAEIQTLSALYMPAERAAEIALSGLAKGLFVIPTHMHELDDATLRFREIERGFENL
jgi:NAD(P)-dependent dehydrogenase (short-subunit alcohol dehydrogenase family)